MSGIVLLTDVQPTSPVHVFDKFVPSSRNTISKAISAKLETTSIVVKILWPNNPEESSSYLGGRLVASCCALHDNSFFKLLGCRYASCSLLSLVASMNR